MTRERNCERENPQPPTLHQWNTVSRKRPIKTPTLLPCATRTIFISHLPPDSTSSDIGSLFSKYGKILNIIIPPSKTKSPQFCYAFIRYLEPKAQKLAINSMNGIKLEGKILIVQPARFDTKLYSAPHFKPLNLHNHPQPIRTTNRVSSNPKPQSFRDKRSFKEVTSPKPNPPPPKPNSYQHSLPTKSNETSPHNLHPFSPPHKIEEPAPDFFVKNPTEARIASTMLLGDATVDARNVISGEELEGDFALVIPGTRNNDLNEMLSRSIFAVALSSQTSSEILESILAEGVNCLTIKPMGGLLHLVTFETVDDKRAMLESNWLDTWFIETRDINKSVASNGGQRP